MMLAYSYQPRRRNEKVGTGYDYFDSAAISMFCAGAKTSPGSAAAEYDAKA
jgi:hypothetical protein